MRVNPILIRDALKARGVSLGKPVDETYLKSFEREMNLSLDRFFRDVYTNFNGFASYDDRSQILLWPLERVLEAKYTSHRVGQSTFHPMGDVLIDSDFLMCCLEKDETPVILLYEKRELAASLSIFFERLLSGDFDFYER